MFRSLREFCAEFMLILSVGLHPASVIHCEQKLTGRNNLFINVSSPKNSSGIVRIDKILT